ncbi:MAG TPA: hypothetical protein VNN09_13420, partial [Candidatus Competibacteraceae bacterium]|nr:hypothetical protein [Candidatus Competibacteraceae bacterium]
MRRWYRRHGPLGAGARLALLLAGSLLAVLVVVSLLHPDDEELQARWLAPLAQQLDALAGLLERTPEREHPPVLAALSGPLLPASLSAAPAVSDDPGWGPQRPLREGLRRQLAGRAPVVGWLPA